MSPQETYAEKINKLLAKAESTTFGPEQDALIAKAQELMAKWAIDDAMLAAVRGVETDEIEEFVFKYGGYYSADHGNLTWTVMRHNGLRGFYMKSDPKWSYAKEVNGKQFKMWYFLTAVGFHSDLERAKLLEASLQIQMQRALSEWWKTEDRSWMSKTQNVRARQSFMEGFTAGVGNKLAEGTRAGREAAERERAKTTSPEEARESVALVLRSRKDRVDDWMDQHHGNLRAGRSSYRRTDYSASSAGRDAGSRADVGQPGLRNRKGLNR